MAAELPGKSSTGDHRRLSCFTFTEASLCTHRPIPSNILHVIRSLGTPRDEPKFLFDPHSIGQCFAPFTSPTIVDGYRGPERRVLAPVPDKAEGLKGEFIASVYGRASEVLSTSSALVVVGYGFNPHDVSSFGPILSAAASRCLPVVLVSPDGRAGRDGSSCTELPRDLV